MLLPGRQRVLVIASLGSGVEVESDMATMTMTTDGIERVVRVLVIVYDGRDIYNAKGHIKSGEAFSKERAQTELAVIDWSRGWPLGEPVV